ncbi:unnamed protein product [Microthlaspi erraticum]|uniref:Protein PHLOEM PROTEIN 2-LIKE A2 n=1 Tax=Microthlaspi erraticum TaxID=1685480 RepID=A0A6D2KP51_9BRAS|nr:unnamed protein product [Microthlaspi erraticum]
MGIILSSLSKPKAPHNYEAILKHADSPLPPDTTSCLDKLYPKLFDGVFLKHKTQKYWIEVVYSDAIVEFAKLEWVAWLEVVGVFETENLTPNCLYVVVFVVKLIDPSQGWEVPVNFKLVLPTGETKERQENMNLLGRNQWMEIPVGEFKTSPEYISGKIEFSMHEVKGGLWKSGLIVKGVAIRPQNK